MNRVLFCMVGQDMSGGNKLFREYMRLLDEEGFAVDVCFWDERRKFEGWPDLRVENVPLEGVSKRHYRFVFLANLFLFPVVLPFLRNTVPVLICMAHESFHFGANYEEAMQESPALLEIMRLPKAAIAISKALQHLLKERGELDSFYLPQGIDQTLFYPRPPAPENGRKRILMVGSYLLGWKGILEGCAALEILSKKIDLELVLMTQAKAGRGAFSQFSFPIEFHYQPPLHTVPEIYGGCHVYCCPSWHEGLGLPVIEAFACGVPVVCTRNHGVDDHGIDGFNLLLAQPGDPSDIAEKLRRILTDAALAEKLRDNAYEAAKPYDWERTRAEMRECLKLLEHVPPMTETYDKAEMDELLARLEKEGLYTPQPVYAQMRQMTADLQEVCRALIESKLNSDQYVPQLMALQQQYEIYLSNPRAEYYRAFQAPMNICKMIVAFKDDQQAAHKLASTFLARR